MLNVEILSSNILLSQIYAYPNILKVKTENGKQLVRCVACAWYKVPTFFHLSLRTVFGLQQENIEESSTMPCKIFLRHDQTAAQIPSSQSGDVCVYAPGWVREGLILIAKDLKNVEFNVYEKPFLKRGRNSSTPEPTEVLESFEITEDFNDGDLVVLQKIARNEPRNTNGVINTSYYLPDIKNVNLIYSIKDLARQCVVVGKDLTTFSGGYKSTRVPQKNEPVYICDLAALQFQKPHNSGRLVLLQEAEPNKGPLDDFIFEKVVGEKKKSFKDVTSISNEDEMKRYIKHDGFGKPGKGSCYLDTKAYKKFVEHDVVLSGLAFSESASKQGHQLNFKFLKYGTGYFAWKFVKELDSLILSGVIDGLEVLFATGNENVLKTIKHLEFPFYSGDPHSINRLEDLKKQYKVDYRFSRDDAVKQTLKGKGLITAVTNCADSNVACGNAMGFKSVDGAISENLATKGNIFCPNMNKLINYKYLPVYN